MSVGSPMPVPSSISGDAFAAVTLLSVSVLSIVALGSVSPVSFDFDAYMGDIAGGVRDILGRFGRVIWVDLGSRFGQARRLTLYVLPE